MESTYPRLRRDRSLRERSTPDVVPAQLENVTL
jgi:hypothetical protein